MLKKYIFSAVTIALAASTADAQSSFDEQISAKVKKSQQQRMEALDSEDHSSPPNAPIGDKKTRAVNYDQASLEELKGAWSISYSIDSSNVYSDTLTFSSVSWASDSTGYAVWGKNKYNSPIGCFANGSFENYKYACNQTSTLGSDYTSWYVFNKNGNSISGGYYIGNATEAASWFASSPARYPLSGTGGTASVASVAIAPAPPAAPTSTQALATLTLQNGWNIASSLLGNQKIDANYLKSQGVGTQWGFDAQSQTYYAPSYIEPGVGYWVKASGALSIPLASSNVAPSTAKTLSSAVVGKWNLLGTPSDTTIENIKTQSGSSQAIVYSYNTLSGAYKTTGAIGAGSGFWYRSATAAAAFGSTNTSTNSGGTGTGSTTTTTTVAQPAFSRPTQAECTSGGGRWGSNALGEGVCYASWSNASRICTLPSKSDWVSLYSSCGAEAMSATSTSSANYYKAAGLNTCMEGKGLSDRNGRAYWTSTRYNSTKTWIATFSSYEGGSGELLTETADGSAQVSCVGRSSASGSTTTTPTGNSGSTTSTGSSAPVYELGVTTLNPYTASPVFVTSCIQLPSANSYKLAFGSTYYYHSMYTTSAACEAAGKAWIASGGNTPGISVAQFTASLASGNSGSGSSGGNLTAAKACADLPYTGANGTPQVDSYAKLAQFDACLHRAGYPEYDAEGRSVCTIMKSLLQATNSNWSHPACNFNTASGYPY